MIINRSDLKYLPLPEATSTFMPVPHATCIEVCQPLFEEAGFYIQREEITIAREGLVMACRFVMSHKAFQHIQSHTCQFIIMNGNDRQHRFRIGVGLECIICSNGMFIAEKEFARKQTKYVLDDLPQLVRSVIAESGTWFDDYLSFLFLLKRVIPTRIETNEILVASAERQIVSSSQIMHVWRNFKNPEFTDYGRDSLDTMHSAFTQVLRSSSPITLPRKSIALDAVFRNIVNQH